MQIRFAKMHGLGNDFMVVDGITQRLELDAELIRRWSDRHTGVGFDQLLVVEPPTEPDADFFYRIYNADGSQAEQCGNGARCLAAFVRREQLTRADAITLQTVNGRLDVRVLDDASAEVQFDPPQLEPAAIGFDAEPGANGPCHQLQVGDRMVQLVPVGVGNPHAVLFVDDISDAPVTTLGPLIERHERFRDGVNVGFCQVVDRRFMRLRVFERGVGETRACGSGACAAVVAARLTERVDERVKVSLTGGKLHIRWQGNGQPITMTGPTALVFEGQIST